MLVVDGTAGTIFQATPDGRIAWKYVVPLNERAHLRQGETAPRPGNTLYRAYWHPPDYLGLQALDLTPGTYIEDLQDIYDKAYAAGVAAIAGDFGEPLADSDFDIYIDQNILIYFKQPCAEEDTRAKFSLHIFPADARDLPANRQEYGFDNLDFNHRGDEIKASGGRCVALRDLPDYPIERIRTGQFTHAGHLWRADIDLGE